MDKAKAPERLVVLFYLKSYVGNSLHLIIPRDFCTSCTQLHFSSSVFAVAAYSCLYIRHICMKLQWLWCMLHNACCVIYDIILLLRFAHTSCLNIFRFLANMNSRSLYAVARPSVVCLSSVTLVRLTQPVEIFRIFLRRLVPWPSVDIHGKFYGDCPRGSPASGGVKRKSGSQIGA